MVNWNYIHNTKNTARYSLGKLGNNMLFCIGINPSTATPVELDNTLKRVEAFAFKNGYDGWMMFNVYPQRSTDPKGLHDKLVETLHVENVKVIKKIMANYKKANIWAAWGVEIERRNFLFPCLKDIAKAIGTDKNWLYLNSLTKNGHPNHPSRLPNNTEFKAFDIKTYLNKI